MRISNTGSREEGAAFIVGRKEQHLVWRGVVTPTAGKGGRSNTSRRTGRKEQHFQEDREEGATLHIEKSSNTSRRARATATLPSISLNFSLVGGSCGAQIMVK